MEKLPLIAVVTTIQPPTKCMETLGHTLRPLRAPLLIIGDKKGPFAYPLPGSDLFTFAQQECLPFALARLLPAGHYTRKNLGYLLAIRRSAACIYETDDDNAPLPNWQPRRLFANVTEINLPGQWFNVYRLFTDEHIWPRGLPLEEVRTPLPAFPDSVQTLSHAEAPIQQGLANGSPDVDAVWRLTLDHDITFRPGPGVRLAPGTWCPFNSQSTWWWPAAYPLLYLPSYCSFRMTDIWRSYVAQRCLWAMGHGLVFHTAEVHQLRNEHNLLRDFEQETEGYLKNAKICRLLADLPLQNGPAHTTLNLLSCYEALVQAGFLPVNELTLLTAWLEDLAILARDPAAPL